MVHPSIHLFSLSYEGLGRGGARQNSTGPLVPSYFFQLLLGSSKAFPGQVRSIISPVWCTEAGRMRFMLRATYYVLPPPHNLSKLIGEDVLYVQYSFTSAHSVRV